MHVAPRRDFKKCTKRPSSICRVKSIVRLRRRDIMSPIEDYQECASEEPFVPYPKDTIFIGARLCPRPQVVKEAISRLKEDIERDKQERTDLTSPLHHNRYTLYAIWTFAFATGVRAIVTP